MNFMPQDKKQIAKREKIMKDTDRKRAVKEFLRKKYCPSVRLPTFFIDAKFDEEDEDEVAAFSLAISDMFKVSTSFLPYDPINAKPEMTESERKLKNAHDQIVEAQLQAKKAQEEILKGTMTAEKLEKKMQEFQSKSEQEKRIAKEAWEKRMEDLKKNLADEHFKKMQDDMNTLKAKFEEWMKEERKERQEERSQDQALMRRLESQRDTARANA